MKQTGGHNTLRVLTAVLLMCLASNVIGAQVAQGQEVLRGLDISTMGLVLHVPGKFRQTLQARAIKQFKDAGFILGEEFSFPRLQLSLWVEESKYCKGIEIYQPKLELLEEVALVRSGHKRIVTTWFRGLEFGYDRKPLTLEELQKEQDEKLHHFIEQYKFLNPKK
jgi:hypothetical protein